MEYNRCAQNKKLYFIGVFFLILFLGLSLFCLYILPFLIWGLHYNVPDLVSVLIVFFNERYQLGVFTSHSAVWLVFLLPSFIAGLISYKISRSLEQKLVEPINRNENDELSHKMRRNSLFDSITLALKIMFFMAVIFGIAMLFDLLLTTS